MKTENPCQCTHFGPLLGYCDHQIHKLMDRRLRRLDISPMQCRVLSYLYNARGEVNQRMLEQFLMVQPSTVNGIVSRLEEKGLLKRTASARDGRCRLLVLTEAGSSLHTQLEDIFARTEAQMEQGFTAGELAQLHSLLLRVAANLADCSEEDAP